jgi:hypothetical protein
MAIDTDLDSLGILFKEHDLYEDNKDHWEYLQNSYEGGKQYRNAGYLLQYANETDGDYTKRASATPLDNHCRSVINVYNSFLFRDMPERDFGGLTEDEVMPLLKDADMDGRNFNMFMKDVSTWSSVFGHAWVMVVKPNMDANSRAEEIELDIRPYLTLLTPLAVIDWQWFRQSNGLYILTYFKYIEERRGNVVTVKEWTPDTITTTVVTLNDSGEATINSEVIEVNELGKIPAVLAYNQRSPLRGIGVSDINDIADQQKFLYNLNSELEEGIRLESHPSLVISGDGTESGGTKVGTGAGSIISVEDMDGDNKPYMLNYTGAGADAILKTEAKIVDAIDKMANTGAVRGTEVSTLSGVAMETEFQLLNARLSDKANNLALAEEHIWTLISEYYNKPNAEVIIEYPDSYNIQDTRNEFNQLSTASGTTENPVVQAEIDRKIMELLDADPELINPADNADS